MHCNDCGNKVYSYQEHCNRCGADLNKRKKRNAPQPDPVFGRWFKQD
ncbi:MAG TPA: hypothetical protein VEC37_12230 [Bacillota bacterium]|nr:hypothetical protein [Bacillota bacterium]